MSELSTAELPSAELTSAELIEKNRRIEEMASIKAFFDINMKGNPDPRLVKPYEDYINLKIDFDEYLKESRDARTEVFFKG
ncbi:MAG: hypothetical protein II929_00760 [Succinivibrio sp.]|nr:hypothetical protein [Succinivibrio sp.]